MDPILRLNLMIAGIWPQPNLFRRILLVGELISHLVCMHRNNFDHCYANQELSNLIGNNGLYSLVSKSFYCIGFPTCQTKLFPKNL